MPIHFLVLFPGAQLPFRRWGSLNFAEVCNYCQAKYHLETVILGNSSDRPVTDEITKLLTGNPVNLTGNTDLAQIPGIVSGARLLITNDSMGAHIGAAVNIPTIVISQMNHYGRFVPYPPGIQDKLYCIIPPAFMKYNREELAERFRFGSNVDIELVNTEQVISAIDILFDDPLRTYQR